jgi:hypothetical protein
MPMKQKSIRVLIIWTTAAALLAYPIYRHNRHLCDSSLLGDDGCSELGSAAPSFWQPFIPIWFFGVTVSRKVIPWGRP